MPARQRKPSTRRWRKSKQKGIATIGMIATDPENDPGPGPIGGSSRSLEKRKPRRRWMSIPRRYRRRLRTVSMDALEAAILDEFASKLAALECCVPKAHRAAARRALLSERAAKLRRLHQTCTLLQNVEMPVFRDPRAQLKHRLRHAACLPSRPLRKLFAYRTIALMKMRHVA